MTFFSAIAVKGAFAVFDMANAYMSHILGLTVDDTQTGVYCRESERRLHPEEGYGMPWGIAVLRRGDAWWISSLPSVADDITTLLDPGNESASGFSEKFIQDSLRVLSLRRIEASSYHKALCYMPAGKAPPSPSDNIRQITRLDGVNRFGYGIPTDSIDRGTAFGAFADGELIGFAEATPLPTVTDNLGIMLVGIEVTEPYRRQGIAHSLLSVLTDRVLGIGKLPWYQCSDTNTASQKTALSCGYIKYGEFLRIQI